MYVFLASRMGRLVMLDSVVLCKECDLIDKDEKGLFQIWLQCRSVILQALQAIGTGDKVE